MPPSRSAFSRTATERPPSAARQAATSPAAPLPTTATSTDRFVVGCHVHRVLLRGPSASRKSAMRPATVANMSPPVDVRQPIRRAASIRGGTAGLVTTSATNVSGLRPRHVHRVRVAGPHPHRGRVGDEVEPGRVRRTGGHPVAERARAAARSGRRDGRGRRRAAPARRLRPPAGPARSPTPPLLRRPAGHVRPRGLRRRRGPRRRTPRRRPGRRARCRRDCAGRR